MPKRGRPLKKTTRTFRPLSDTRSNAEVSISPEPTTNLNAPSISSDRPPPAADHLAPVTMSTLNNVVSSQISSKTSEILERMKKLEELVMSTKTAQIPSTSGTSNTRYHENDKRSTSGSSTR